MTKDTELKILDEAIAALGPESYCGAWLADVRAEVESNLRCDLIPAMTVLETKRQCEALTAAATLYAADVRHRADQQATATTLQAHQRTEAIRGRAAGQLRECLRTLDS